MHLQIRSEPTQSPPNLVAFLEVIKRAGINIIAAGGSDVERGGEFAFAVDDNKVKDAMEALAVAGYHPRLVQVDFQWITDRPGQLHEFVARVAAINAPAARAIKDIAIGGPDADGRILVQVYSVAR